KATADSCLDMQVIVPTESVADVEEELQRFSAASEEVRGLLRAGRFSELHLDVWDGVVTPGVIEAEGFDYLEVSVGNLFVYSVPLYSNGDRFERIAAGWLPFYDDALRHERLAAARWFVLEQKAGELEELAREYLVD